MTRKEIQERIAWLADTTSSSGFEASRMKIFGNRIAKEIIDSTIDESIKAIDSLGYTRYDNFDYFQITEALERLRK